ncbi:hypothetical protein BRAS3843_2520016 [Bradyrhizobium sp. STM 3843]|nr:hypothetical protein BRAS3843_2520016 [Bradyrhizobium sp. STM 3843]
MELPLDRRTSRRRGTQYPRDGKNEPGWHRMFAPFARTRPADLRCEPDPNTTASGILDRPPEPVVGLAEGETRWRTMTLKIVASASHFSYVQSDN